MMTSDLPAASSTSAASVVDRASPPSCPRVAMLRMNTSRIGRVRLHPEAVAENRAAGERTGRVHGDDADRLSARARFGDQPIDQRALAGAGRAGDADEIGAAGVGKDRADQIGCRRRFVFDERNRAGDGARIAGQHAIGERGSGHGLTSAAPEACLWRRRRAAWRSTSCELRR